MANLSKNTTALKPGAKKKADNSSAGTSPIKAKKKLTTAKGGGVASALKDKSSLFLTAVSTFAGEDTYYESGSDRINRLVDLTHKVTKTDPDWVERFVEWLRGPDANIRTASLIIATEYVYAGGPNGRKVINSVCQRADEPAEILAWVISKHYGKDAVSYPLPSPKIPQAIRKGLGDATRRLYNEYSAMKYSGANRGVGMADVLNLVHPKPVDDKQAKLFKYIIDKSYGNDVDLDGLDLLRANHELRKLTPAKFRKNLNAADLKAAGVTWEQVGGYLGGAWDADAWEAVIPSMGYMATLRNLRNFEQAKIGKAARDSVIAKLTDPEQVARSRQMPFRFLSAYKNTVGSHYLSALEDALDLSVKNIPSFKGRTLVLVDKSGSMNAHLSSKAGVNAPRLWEVGALFGVALALAGEDVDLAIFGTTSKAISLPKGSSVLRGISALGNDHRVGWGTNTNDAARKHYNGHDRIVIFTDVQPNYGQAVSIPEAPFIHYFDIGGYGQGALDLKDRGRFQYGGFTDSTFKLMSILEHAEDDWPF